MTFNTLKMLNEAKLHRSMSFGGMSISIEVPAGGYRTGKSRDGKEWKHKIGAHYGYIKGTHSPDGEHLDCYVRKNPKSDAKVYVVHQLSVDGSKFDEDKVMLGFASAAEARAMFKACTFKPTIMYGGMTEFTLEHFRVVAYSASRSKAMLTDEETFSEFRKKGLMPKGVISPLTVAQRVSESITEGEVSFSGLLGSELQDLGDALAEGDIRHCLDTVGWEGTPPKSEQALNHLIAEAFDYFVGSGIQDSNYLDDDEFRQRALLIISNEDALMTDITDDFVTETPDHSKMPQITFPDLEDCKIARRFAIHHGLLAVTDANKLVFTDANDYERYMELAQQSGDVVTLMGDQMEDLKAAGYEDVTANRDATAPYDPRSVFPAGTFKESYTVMVTTQRLENVGSEFAPMWSHSTGRNIVIESGLDSYGAARKVAAEVGAGIIPVAINLHESVVGIEVITDGEYRQFYETAEAEEAVEEDTTEDVFFAQQIQEVQELAGIEETVAPERSAPSVHDLKAKLAALQEEFEKAKAEELKESPFQASLADFPKAMRIVGKTLIKNPNADPMRCVKAVAGSTLQDPDLADELAEFITDQTGMGLDAYAAEVRETKVVEDQSEEAWTCVQQSTYDVTGDDVEDAMQTYGTTELVDKKPAGAGDPHDRDILTYMNPEKTHKMVMTPTWDERNGEYYVISVFKKGSAIEEGRFNGAQQRGADDYRAGKSLQEPPEEWPTGSALRGDWITGWRFAQRDDRAAQFKKK